MLRSLIGLLPLAALVVVIVLLWGVKSVAEAGGTAFCLGVICGYVLYMAWVRFETGRWI